MAKLGETVELKDYLAVLGRRWRILLSLTLVGLLAGFGVAFVLPPTYTAQAQLFVSTSTGQASLTQLYQGGDFSQERVKSYAKLATSPRVTNPVVKELHLALTPAELGGKVSAEAPLDTVLVNINVSDESAQQAAALANAVADRLRAVVQSIETPPGEDVSPVKVSLVREAQPPRDPDPPGLLMVLGLGLLAGLALGIGMAVLRESMDTSVKSGADLAAATDLPVLATVRNDPASKDKPILENETGSARAEAFRQLRTNMQYADVDHHPRLIVVTSAVAAEGKTSVAGNLAATMADIGLRVCLLDGDLRQPRCAEYFGLVGEVGLTTVLIGRATVRQVLQPAGDGLDVLTSGDTPPNPSELLGSERMRDILTELAHRYDIVLIDAPPVLPVTDAAVLASFAEASLMVVRVGKTSRAQVAEATAALQKVGSRVLGGVLNMAPRKTGSPYTYGGYRYRYVGTTAPEPSWPQADSPPVTIGVARNGTQRVGVALNGGPQPDTDQRPAAKAPPTPHGAVHNGTGRAQRPSESTRPARHTPPERS